MMVSGHYHLTYCTNIHPGENWKVTFENLKKYVPIIKRAFSANNDFGLGLRLSNQASIELAKDGNLEKFKEWLHENGVYIFTMNGFPYGNFHHQRVKDQVHAPDWTTDERYDYTSRLFDQLTILLPKGMSGGISTSPVSYKHWFSSKDAIQDAFEKGARNMLEIAQKLYQIEQEKGIYLHLDIEPEPDGLLENTEDVLMFFNDYLLPIGAKYFKKRMGLNAVESEALIKRHLTLCYDVCHFSLAYEEPGDTFEKLREQGVRIGKVQISAALKLLFDEAAKEDIWNALSRFDEPVYLHQVTERTGESVKTYSDLPEVLGKKNDFLELRAHFHVPIFLEQFAPLYSTQDHIIKVLDYLKKDAVCDHLEVETYTWEVLPEQLKEELPTSIVRELNWVKQRLGR
ncbi:metabolite traffic protein EboE [Allomuricauda sp. SCSIO 65647]|uniref:metabolite traffic protein EboE n=1 Tax=Allomuricauda sp. SCSIO 65647 TaxID=2908843 RepID=UPI001F3D4D0B|nr:metabolite traffic protein EboE [Muricauda sp. SCSIO 65647]UJH66939.1 metabolite traffic protein EboE [Muricauda sp. SCSIO 65647]